MLGPFDRTELVKQMCRITDMWALVICPDIRDFSLEEVLLACPYLSSNRTNDYRILIDGWGVFYFSTLFDALEYYNMTVGDDGPTELNPYSGPARVYATIIGPDGFHQYENT